MLNTDTITIHRRAAPIRRAVDELKRDPYSDSAITRAAVEAALWDWLDDTISDLMEDLTFHTHGPTPLGSDFARYLARHTPTAGAENNVPL